VLETSKIRTAGLLATLVATLVFGVLTGTAVAQRAEARDVGEPGP
jgi:hypothetical protein